MRVCMINLVYVGEGARHLRDRHLRRGGCAGRGGLCVCDAAGGDPHREERRELPHAAAAGLCTDHLGFPKGREPPLRERGAAHAERGPRAGGEASRK